VLRLTLHPYSYEWKFLPESGSFTDTGTTACHGSGSTVVLSSFSAKRTARGVLVRWRTSEESAIRGYILYREQSGRRVRLNRTLIAASRRAYSLLDRGARAGALRYRLQAVDLKNRRSWLGLVGISR
jgi:hypothetical protein